MDKMQLSGSLFNYVTQQFDVIEGKLFDLSDEQLTNYVPQIGGKGMYEVLRKTGWTKQDALLRVMHAVIGETYEREETP